MTGVRVLVGTRKGAFILTADGKRQKWDVSGPHFGGWEIYHLKGSPVDPNRLYVSQSGGWFGQQIQRSDDGGKTWEPVSNEFVYDGVTILAGSPEHWALMRAVCEAKFTQHDEARIALLATGKRWLTHKVRKDSRTIPGAIMADIWMGIRARLQQEEASRQ